MQIVNETFDERIEDIDIYIEYLESLGPISLETKLRNILLANGYLLLYNLIEATLQSICKQIHEVIEKEQLDYEKLSDSLKLIYWNSLHKKYSFRVSENFPNRLVEIANELLAKAKVNLNEHNPIQGNVSSDTIRKFTKSYGLSTNLLKNSIEEQAIQTIMKKRQILAHGENSFSSLGSEVLISDLKREFEQIKEYLNDLIFSTKEYIDKKQYSQTH